MIFLNAHSTENQVTELNAPKDNRMTENRIFKSIFLKLFHPNSEKSEKYLVKNFVYEETGKTVKNSEVILKNH